jgi:SET domain-containing protein
MWPENVVYTNKLVWDEKLKNKNIVPKECEYINLKEADKHKGLYSVKRIMDPSHPAFKQYGLFAKKKIPKSAWIIDYFGYVTLEYSKTSDYVLKYIDDLSIDAEKMGNEARMVNDFRGIRERPNCQFLLYKDLQTNSFKMGVFALNNEIKKGEELCVTYGKSFWKARSGIVPNI